MRPDWEGALHHVMARGILGEALFMDGRGAADMAARLSELVPGLSFRVFAWVIMPNHLHLLLASGPVPLSRLMHSLLTGFAVSYNLRHERVGHVFQGRFKSILVEHEAYFRKLVRYIHLNPLRAGIVPGVEELDAYPWSGHAAMTGHATCRWMDARGSLLEFGTEESAARKSYLEALDADVEGREDCLEFDRGTLIIGPDGLEEVDPGRDEPSWSTGLRVLGGREFAMDVLNRVRGAEGIRIRDRQWVHDGLGELFAKIEARRGYGEAVLRGRSRSPELAFLRAAIAWVAARRYGLTCGDISRLLGCTRSAVTCHLRRSRSLLEDDPFIFDFLIQ